MMRSLLAPALLLTVGVVALAQTPNTPATQPKSARDTIDEMLKPSADKRPPLQPIPGDPQVNKASIDPVDPRARPATLKREGSYVVNRTGRVVKGADGQSVEFVFESDGQAMQDPPMVLLPNLALMMMQNNLHLANRDLRFRVTGMVTEYMGRNYLLVQKAVTVND